MLSAQLCLHVGGCWHSCLLLLLPLLIVACRCYKLLFVCRSLLAYLVVVGMVGCLLLVACCCLLVLLVVGFLLLIVVACMLLIVVDGSLVRVVG